MQSYSPLRYPGGKAKIYYNVKNIIESNFLFPPVYAEAFAGGSSLAIRLLLNNIVSEIHINDLDYSIYAFWYSIKHHKNELIEMITSTEVDIDQWRKQKDIYKSQSDGYSIIQKGFATFFLNRTNRSGVLNAGPIGGYDQKGNYKIDCRFNKPNLIHLINQIYDKIDNIHIYNLDAKDFILSIDQTFRDAFIYLDPPYVVQGPNLYMNHFVENDHVHLKEVVSQLHNKWLVTYDNVDLIKNIYNEYSNELFNIQYSMSNKRIEKEIAIYSDNIQR